MKVLIFGWFGERFTGEFLAQGFEAKGAQVVRISTEPAPPEKSGKCDVYIMNEYAHRCQRNENKAEILTEAYELQFNFRRLYLRDYINRYPDCDLVFFIQNKFAWDFEGVTKPVYYYHTTILTTNLPLHAEVIKGFFYAYIGANEELRDSNLYEFNHWYYTQLIPYGANAKRYYSTKSWEGREIFCGFMGSYAQENHCKSAVKEQIYQNRWQIISQLAKSNEKDFFKIELRKATSVEKYAEFLQNCKVAINIPGNFGKLNQRQFEILGAGALLLQWWYPELKELGFINYENYLAFSSLEDLISKLHWIQDHPAEADKIRLAGMKYFLDHRCSWQQRGEMIFEKIMQKPSSHDQEWIDCVEYQKQKEADPQIPLKYPVQMFMVKAK